MKRYVIISDGLGNQMFQYAFLLALRAKGFPVIGDVSLFQRAKMHNGFELKDVFKIKDDFISRNSLNLLFLRCLLTIKICPLLKFDNNRYDESIYTKWHLIYRGYWQDSRYFQDVENIVRKAFSFMNIDSHTKSIAEQMMGKNSVSLHIRRGDYVGHPQVESICNEEYYRTAISLLKSKVIEPFFYIFSDDLNWANTFIKSMDVKYRLVEGNQGANSYKDMFLMTQCKHHIIANSTFSWWGAWLNPNKDKIVIAPKTWSMGNHHLRPQLNEWFLI